VNDRQLDVLNWVVAGCPAREWPDTTYKTVAVALQNRRLVRVSKKKGIWSVTATDAGRYFVEHGAYPAGHWSEDPVEPKSAKPARTGATPSTASPQHPAPAAAVRTPASAATSRDRVTAKRPVEQFADDVLAAMTDESNTWGGLMVEDRDRGHYANLARSAERYGKTPEGKQWVEERVLDPSETRWRSYKTVWKLIDLPDWLALQPDAIPVVQSLTARSHAAVRAVKAEKSLIPFKQPTRSRALRLLDALARAAEQKGYIVEEAKRGREHNSDGAVLVFRLKGHRYRVRMVELMDRLPHVPTKTELREAERHSWVRIPTHDPVPSGRLQVEILGYSSHPAKFADTKRQTLDDRLPFVLQALELRAADDEAARIKREDEEAARRRQWEQVHANARVEYTEAARASVLNAQVERFVMGQRIDEYLSALHRHVESLSEPEELSAAREWEQWVSAYRASLNPFAKRVGMPSVREPQAEDLKPFMRGLSPYGPDSDRWR